MERFVQAIVGGGLSLVAGLWLATLASGPALWAAGTALVLLGLGGVAYGLWDVLET
ncbi:MAG: hypothetical protein ACLFTE_06545 [Salinivenus sp.]